VKVAVIGGGVFGATAAVELARTGAQVDLYEAGSDLLDGATGRCQARLHSGYHYPRSDTTATACRDAAPEFAARYPEAIRTAVHHYVIADDSRVSAGEYLAFLDRNGLPYEVVEPRQVHHAKVTVRVPEAFVDIPTLRQILRRDLYRAGVGLHVGRWLDAPLTGYDLTVVATYGQPWSKPLRYEVCEVALVEVGRYDGLSFVVLDGEYVSLDPHGRTHMLYDVAHTVHAANVGSAPEIPDHLADLLGRLGPVRSPVSRVDAMLDSASRHLRMLGRHGQGVAIYHGSWFSVRAVLPDVDATDERPTLVERDGDVVSILSGKICTAVSAARAVIESAAVAA
jgi:hypothetical protein